MSGQALSEIERLRNLDSVCEQFEQSWIDGEPVDIEECLGSFREPDWTEGLNELIQIELEFRRRRGESPEADGYIQRFPDYADGIRSIFEVASDRHDENLSPEHPLRKFPHVRDLFKGLPPFSETDPEALSLLLENATTASWSHGEFLLMQGQPARAMLLIVEGVAQVIHVSDGYARVVSQVSPGDVVGEMSILMNTVCTADVVACGDLVCCVVERDEVLSVIDRVASFRSALLDLVSSRMKDQGRQDILYGRKAGNFRICECLGRGGMGIVYRGESDDEDGTSVALKMLNHRLTADHRAVQRFRREVNVGRQLSHENIIRALGSFSAFGTRFIVQEYCPGRPLCEVIERSGPLEEKTARGIVGQVAAGLIHAHQNDIIHRDVKPANVMVTIDGDVRLADFGLASAPSDSQLTSEGMLIGTPAYMAPEIISNGKVTDRADVYGLGSLALELLTGQPVFKADNVLLLFAKRSNWTLPAREDIPTVPDEDFYEFLRQSLQQDPDMREVDLAEIAKWADRAPNLIDESWFQHVAQVEPTIIEAIRGQCVLNFGKE